MSSTTLAVTPTDMTKVSGVSNSEKKQIPGIDERPVFLVLDERLEEGGQIFRPGVWYFAIDRDGTPTQTWVCSPLYIEAVTYDGQHNNFGRLLRFMNSLGHWREWAMQMEMLAGAGDELRRELLAMGVEINSAPKARNLLPAYLQDELPMGRMRGALQTGWCEGSFVLPDTVIGPNSSAFIFQSGESGHHEHTVAGTLAGWQAEISARAVGNPFLTLALSTSFAGPLLGRCRVEGGGFHFVGDSSTGKTTLLEAGCSVWGGPNYRRSWRATANGMEGAAVLFNDCLLALDEISEADRKEVGAIVYALGNGRGKQRAGRTGAVRALARWTCSILSSGERTVATTMQEGGHKSKAGQAVRLLDISVARRFGAWDDLHGLPSGTAFSDAIKRAAAIHYGHAGRAFLECLTRDTRDFCAYLDRIKDLREFYIAGGEGQGKRAAARFALIALAGELATEYGITGWPEGAAIAAAAEAFKVWRAERGPGNDESGRILQQVAGFIQRHGDSRFSNANAEGEVQIYNRAGWWIGTGAGREYLFTADGMNDALKGFDYKRALDALEEAGALPPRGADGKRAQYRRIRGQGHKLYHIRPDQLGGDDGD
jgi:putative DNA primase/helicase